MLDGSVQCWGTNYRGRLGVPGLGPVGNDTSVASAPKILLPVNTTAVQLSVGDSHACVVLSNGRILCWGSFHQGKLGGGHTSNVGDNENVRDGAYTATVGNQLAVRVSCNRLHSCAVLANGSVQCWGNSDSGRLGVGNVSHIPDTAPADARGVLATIGGLAAVDVSAGRFGGCMVLSNGTVQCWGSTAHGRVGLGTPWDGVLGDNEPINVAGFVSTVNGSAAVQASMGDYTTCALLVGGHVQCWGDSTAHGSAILNNNIGNNQEASAGGVVPLLTPGTAVQVSVGSSHACAVLSTGDVQCWGSGSRGQLGYGNTNDVGIFPDLATSGGGVPRFGGLAALSVSAGTGATCITLTGGAVQCWGRNEVGQLGIGSTDDIGDDETASDAGLVPLPSPNPLLCSPTPSLSPSVTPSGTPSTPGTPSGTPSASNTPSGTPSASNTPSGTPSASNTPSGTPSASNTPSGSPSTTSSPTETPSATATASVSPSVTPSISLTPTVSPSASPSPELPSATAAPSSLPPVANIDGAPPEVRFAEIAPVSLPTRYFSLVEGGQQGDQDYNVTILARGRSTRVRGSVAYAGVLPHDANMTGLVAQAVSSNLRGDRPSIWFVGSSVSEPLRLDRWTRLNFLVRVRGYDSALRSAVRGGDLSRVASHDGLFVFRLRVLATHDSSQHAEVPFAVDVRTSGAAVSPGSITLYAGADGTLGAPLTSRVEVAAAGSLGASWTVQQTATTLCWLSLTSPDVTSGTGTAQQGGATDGGSKTTLQLAVDLSRLVKGIISAQVQVVLGDLGGTRTVSIPILIFVSLLQPCPSVLSLQSRAPSIQVDTVPDQGIVERQRVTGVRLRNLGPVTSTLFEAVVLPEHVPVGIEVDCTDPNPPPSPRERYHALLNGTGLAPWVAPALPVAGVNVAGQSAAELGLDILFSAENTSDVGVYRGTVLGLAAVGDPQDNTTIVELVAIFLQQPLHVGPLSPGASTVHLLQEALTPNQNGIVLPDGMLIATLDLRDAVGHRVPLEGNFVTASTQVVGGTGLISSCFNNASAVDPLTARVRVVTAEETGLPEDTAGVVLPVQLLDVVANATRLQVEVRARGEVLANVPLQARAAPCDGRGARLATCGLQCVCAPGFGAVLEGSRVGCEKCPFGTFSPRESGEELAQACLPCGEGTLAAQGSAQCVPCPLGTECAKQRVVVLPGYGFSVPPTADTLNDTTALQAVLESVTLCPYPLVCEAPAQEGSGPTAALTDTSCRHPHAGHLCGQCVEGFTYSSVPGGATMQCVACGDNPAAIVGTVIAIGMLALLAQVWLWVTFTQQNAKSQHTHTRLMALVIILLHLQWSSLISTYRQTTPETEAISALAPAASILPMHTWYMACFLGPQALLKGFALSAAMPLVVSLLTAAIAGVFSLFSNIRHRISSVILPAVAMALCQTIPHSLQLMLSSGLIVQAGPEEAVLAADFATKAGSADHILLLAVGVLVSIAWCALVVALLWLPLCRPPAARDGNLRATAEAVATGLAQPVAWFAAVWLGSSVLLALVAAMSTPPIGRAFAAGCVATASAMLHLYALPYALSVPGQVFSGSAHMSALWVTGALTHCGSAVQAWFSYALQAWEAGLFFSGAGSANPFFVPIQTALPPVQTLCYFAINAGFWLPAGAAILTLLYPEWTSHLPDDAFFLCNCARGFGGASNRGESTMGGWNKSLRHISVGSKEPDVAEILNSRRRRSLRMQANPMQARKK